MPPRAKWYSSVCRSGAWQTWSWPARRTRSVSDLRFLRWILGRPWIFYALKQSLICFWEWEEGPWKVWNYVRASETCDVIGSKFDGNCYFCSLIDCGLMALNSWRNGARILWTIGTGTLRKGCAALWTSMRMIILCASVITVTDCVVGCMWTGFVGDGWRRNCPVNGDILQRASAVDTRPQRLRSVLQSWSAEDREHSSGISIWLTSGHFVSNCPLWVSRLC